MDRPTESLAKIGSDPALRAAQLNMLRQVEKAMARPDFDVREEVTGPIVDALHEGVGPLTKRLRGGIDFHFHYRSKIARDFVMSPDAEPDHVWEPQKTRSEEHTSELPSLMRISSAVSSLKNKT